jgi:hypothetical protein
MSREDCAPFSELSANLLRQAATEAADYLPPFEDADASLWLRVSAKGWLFDIVARPRVAGEDLPPPSSQEANDIWA